MKVSNPTSGYINQAYTNAASQNLKSNKSSDKASTKEVSTTEDRIVLSDQTQKLQKMAKAMETESSDRQKYVDEIKQKVESDQYNIDPEAIAEKMAESLMV